MSQLNKITLVSISDGKNIEASRKSIEGFMKYNGPNVIGVNTQLSSDFENMCKSLGASVFTPHTKYGYPVFTKDQCEEHIDFFYTTTLKPAMMADTEYIMFSEPDSVFCNTIRRDVFDGSDIIIPSSQNEKKAMWAFAPFFDAFGTNDGERMENIYTLFDKLKISCRQINLDFDRAGRKDMRFCLTANSIMRTEKVRQFYTKEKEPATFLMKEIAKYVDEIYPKEGINPYFSKFCTHFSPDQMISIIFGLYEFNWRFNDNGINCNPSNFNNENDLIIFLENNPNAEYIHCCKVYYNK